MREQLIRQVPLFASLPPDEIQSLSETLHPVEFPAGALLFREGEPGDLFYVLLDGEIEIIKAYGTPDERLLGIRKVGSFIGEMSLFSPERKRTASVRAHTPLQMLEMSRDEFDDLLHRHPMLAYNMIKVLSTRLNEAENVTIQDLRLKNQELTIAYEELKAAQAQFIEKEKMEQELEVARRIQLSMMPRLLPKQPRYTFEAHIQPMRAVGGDFYDFIPLDDDHLGIAIGDVSNHGVPAALFMAMTVTLLRAEAHRSRSPAEVLRQINRQLLLSNDANMFVTLLYGVLCYKSGEFHYARAGHSLPLLCDRQGAVQELAMTPGGFLGVWEDIALEETSCALRPRYSLVLYTDGITEEMNAQKKLFGLARLTSVLEGIFKTGACDICPTIMQALQSYRGDSQQSDDITLLAIHAH